MDDYGETGVMRRRRIRPIALAVIRKGTSILVYDGWDALAREEFFRPLGGGIEFGERAEEALAREIQEELGEEIAIERPLGTLENLFVHEGRAGHEIVFLFEARFTNPDVYSRDVMQLREDDGRTTPCRWLDLADLPEGTRVYPAGLLQMLDSQKSR